MIKRFLLITFVCVTSPAIAYLQVSSRLAIRSIQREGLLLHPREEQSVTSSVLLQPRGLPKAGGRKSDAISPSAPRGSEFRPQTESPPKHATDPKSDQPLSSRAGRSNSRLPLPPNFRSDAAAARSGRTPAPRDDRPRKTQNDPAIGGPSLENPKTVAGSQSGKPPRSPRIIDMTPIFNTLGEMQKDWPHGDRSSPPSEGHKQVFPDPILPQKGPPDIGAKGIQTPRPKEPLERTPDGRLGAPSKPKGKPPKM